MENSTVKDDFYKAEYIAEWNERSERLLGEICHEMSLNTRAAEFEICDLLERNGSKELLDKNRTLMTLAILSKAERSELNDGKELCVFTNRNIDELVDLYENIVFFLRRLEFSLPLEYVDSFPEYMIKEHISANLIHCIIAGTYYLYNKQAIWDRFRALIGGTYEGK